MNRETARVGEIIAQEREEAYGIAHDAILAARDAIHQAGMLPDDEDYILGELDGMANEVRALGASAVEDAAEDAWAETT